jgi:hypothetical protein
MAVYIYPPVSVTTLPPVGGATSANQLSEISELQAINSELDNILNKVAKFKKDGVVKEVSYDTLTPSNSEPLPVNIIALNGQSISTTVDLTGAQINCQLSDRGTSPDATRIGDGTYLVGVTANNEIKSHDADLLAAITTLLGKDFATQTTLAALLTELKLKADLSETQPVSAASLPLPTGAATDTKLDEVKALLGATNETPPGLDTDPSGLNGRLTKITQKLTALKNLFPSTIGQKAKADSLSVTIASDQEAIPTTLPAQTGSFDEDLTVTTTPETFIAPAGAFGCFIETKDSNPVNIRVKMGGTASPTSGIQFQPGRSEFYQGGSNISYCNESGSTGEISVQWFRR